jgi:hypothetical protein
LCGGYDDQLPAGVSTSTAISLSHSKTPAAAKLLTCRLHEPAPRLSTGTSAAAPYRKGSRREHTAEGRANRPPSVEVIVIDASRGT